MLNVINKTPFEASYSIQNNLQGYGVVCVFFAANFVFANQRWHIAQQQMPSPLNDVYWNKDKPSSIRLPSQLSHSKPGTDIIMNANAIAPKEQAVTHLHTGIQVANMQASVMVFGDRVWDNDRITPPRPFFKIPIVWEQAFGGSIKTESGVQQYEYNPLGLGWSPSAENPDGTRLPNIEWPQQLIHSPEDKPVPAGYGALGPQSPLRSCYAGTYDENWKKTRCPYVPHDFDSAFFYSAIPALRAPGFLQGNEGLRLVNVTRESDLSLHLPGGRPQGEIMLGKKMQTLTFNLETVVIDTTVDDASAATPVLSSQMFWRATAPTTRSVADIKDIRVWLAR